MSEVVLLSGGIDSAVVLAWLIKYRDKEKLHGMFIRYGQRHYIQEYKAAMRIADEYNVPLMELQVDRFIYEGANSYLFGNSLANHAMPIVPGRNLMMLAMVAAYAEVRAIKDIYIGTHMSDEAGFPDCSFSFLKAATEAIRLSSSGKVQLQKPLVNMLKAEVIKLGVDMHVPFELTYSCYQGEPFHCGVCLACQERQKAFKLAGVQDPTVYKTLKGVDDDVHETSSS